MKVEKFKVLLYLKKSGTDKSGKAPIMGRITVNRTMAQFGCKLSCRPDLWNARESRLDGKSREDFEKIRDVEIPAWRTTHIYNRQNEMSENPKRNVHLMGDTEQS